jgi:hypothetical protein
MFNAKPFQVGFVLLQSADGFVSFHKNKYSKPEPSLPRLSPDVVAAMDLRAR